MATNTSIPPVVVGVCAAMTTDTATMSEFDLVCPLISSLLCLRLGRREEIERERERDVLGSAGR